MSRRVLIVNVTRMGDLVQMGTLLARLQEEWPGVQVDLVIDRRFSEVTSLLAGVEEVVPYDFHEFIDNSRIAKHDVGSLYREMRAWVAPLHERRYDRIINLTFNPASAFLSSYMDVADIRGARCGWDGRMIIDNPWMNYFSDMHHFRSMNRFNLVDVYALGGSGPGKFAPLRACIPAEAGAWAKHFLAMPGNDSHQWIAVQAGASDVMKAWRPEHFGVTLARLSDKWSGGIVLVGAPGEQATAAQVVQVYRGSGGKNPVKNAVGHTSVSQLTALLAESRVLLTNDTGPMHLAVAVQTPVIDVSVGHVDFRETGPYGRGHWVVQPQLDCAPCGFQQVCAHHSCKDRIPSERIAELMLHVLGKAGRPSSDPGFRLYESDVDEDQLGTFRLRGGVEAPLAEWYAEFWRRYAYKSWTGLPSRLPVQPLPPPDARLAMEHIALLIPRLDALCRRAGKIAQVASRRPLPVNELQRLQHTQAEERERAIAMGMRSPATGPVTVAFVRSIHSDDLQGLDRLAQYHAQACRKWRVQVVELGDALSHYLDGTLSRPLAMASGM
ncbi:putative Glycosyl transferase, family 9 [Nitrospira sp. KM1]|uniref:glycosyltransferase family 9 protein n=1 Tax=Nitrospira sp. KM1 TaxID=1936990 RepID=UPI0013A740ED|nr:glycosyltransferase family 9 protein [Nitrospira sp. KM1]BCA54774.1 putative Glycosyl transferase, family 9 [Nitrospira sp. KM1]